MAMTAILLAVFWFFLWKEQIIPALGLTDFVWFRYIVLSGYAFAFGLWVHAEYNADWAAYLYVGGLLLFVIALGAAFAENGCFGLKREILLPFLMCGGMLYIFYNALRGFLD